MNGRTNVLASILTIPLLAAAEPLSVDSNRVVEAGFTVDFKVDLDGAKDFEKLYEIPGVFHLDVRQSNDGTAPSGYDTWLGNYDHFPLPDGSHTVLEAVTADGYHVGVPLGTLKRPSGVHTVRFSRTKAHWRLWVDERLDEDFPRTALSWPVAAQGNRLSARVKEASFTVAAKPVPAKPDSAPVVRPIQFWTPDDHNAWVGDVTLYNWKGRMHLFYLYDRRHHQSKGEGGGGHRFAHLSSSDLVHWFEHPNATELEELWETHGTGTPYEHEGKLCLAYGHHSERFVPIEQTTAPILEKWCAEHNGREGVFKISELGVVPVGGTFAYSSDGIHFRKSGTMITRDENPSVYRRSDGRWGLGRGTALWVTDEKSPTGWYCFDDNTGSRGDCPMPFDWNGWHYLIQGFCFFSMSRTGAAGTWSDRVLRDEHPYDGMSVPMVAPFGKNRRIIAGWIRFPGCWGGFLCLRELVQHSDGVLGLKWLPEAPHAEKPVEYRVAKGGKLVVRYNPSPAAHPLEFSLDAAERRAQFADVKEDGTTDRQKTLAEVVSRLEPEKRWTSNINEGRPDVVMSYAIANLRGLENGGTVRMVAHYDPKANSTVFDVEIAGVRTMLAVRYGKFVLAK